ncbi:MAG: hypothetical protein QXM68_01305 [Candidatus Aenigmatarchaeota archaeon]|nr:hypothetical protein [Candidatus Aenigmarchaeota archaeon]
MFQTLIGLLLLFLSIFFVFKIIGNVVKTVFIAVLLLISYYLIFGYIPYTDKIDLKSIFGLSIQDVERDKENNLLVYVKNNWLFAAKNLNVLVDENNASILNNITQINGRDKSILQVQWDKEFGQIVIQSNIGQAKYKK